MSGNIKIVRKFIKNFAGWFKLKIKLDSLKHKPPFFKEREVWWCYIGENIGTEISGKGEKYNRPVIIFKKLSQYTFLGIPTTTQLFNEKGDERLGSWFIKIVLNNIEMLAVLNQIRILDYRRMDNKMATLGTFDFQKIGEKFNKLYQYKKYTPK
jgi:mRNA interferase MazF